jgi:phage anti-repressor protein
MNELIKVTEENGKQTVSARDLHRALEVGRDFSTWIKGRIEEYGFAEGEDYHLDSPNLGNQDVGWGGDRRSIDYLLSVGMAKEIAIMENNKKGREIRRYLIKVEEAWNTPEMVVQRALQTGEVIPRETFWKTFEEMKQAALAVMQCPFPGPIEFKKYPSRVEYSVTEKGGRVYALYPRRNGRNCFIILYDPQGAFLRAGIALTDAGYDKTVAGLVTPYTEVIGAYTGQWEYDAPGGSYLVWQAAQLEKRLTSACEQNRGYISGGG